MIQHSAHVRRILELAWEEAAGLGHRYLGPEHLLLGIVRDGRSDAAMVLRLHGMDLAAARAALHQLAERGVVPGPRPSDAELLGLLGVDLYAVRRHTELAFGRPAVEMAIREATRARHRGIGRVPRSPLQGPPMLAVQALHLTSEQAKARGYGEVSPELLLLGVLDDITTPWPRCMSNPWVRQLHASVGLPDGYRGAAGPLLATLGVDMDHLRDAVSAALGNDVHQG